MIKFLIGVAVGVVGTLIYIEKFQDQDIYEEVDAIAEQLDRTKGEIYYREDDEKPSVEYIGDAKDPLVWKHSKDEAIGNSKVTINSSGIQVSVDRKKPALVVADAEHEDVDMYVITKEDFDTEFEEFDKFEIEYNVIEDILMDEAGDPVEPEHVVSRDLLDVFYNDSKNDIVYVRNLGLEIDYQVMKTDGHGNPIKSTHKKLQSKYHEEKEAILNNKNK